jgi:hypothetical protein
MICGRNRHPTHNNYDGGLPVAELHTPSPIVDPMHRLTVPYTVIAIWAFGSLAGRFGLFFSFFAALIFFTPSVIAWRIISPDRSIRLPCRCHRAGGVCNWVHSRKMEGSPD